MRLPIIFSAIQLFLSFLRLLWLIFFQNAPEPDIRHAQSRNKPVSVGRAGNAGKSNPRPAPDHLYWHIDPFLNERIAYRWPGRIGGRALLVIFRAVPVRYPLPGVSKHVI